jgi:hypothetical protein
VMGESQRRLITIVAAVGLLLSVVRLLTLAPAPEHQAAPPRAKLAQDMELFESAMQYGLDISLTAYRSVKSDCAVQREDSVVMRACAIFVDALRHDADRRAIDAAVQLLRPG